MQLPSTKPYLLRAIWEWCCDHAFTPHVVVLIDERTRVPREYARDGQIVLNIGQDATSRLKIGNEWLEFQARFGGVARDISVPVGQVVAIYARENGAGMSFEPDPPADGEDSVRLEAVADPKPEAAGEAQEKPAKPPTGRPGLKRVK